MQLYGLNSFPQYWKDFLLFLFTQTNGASPKIFFSLKETSIFKYIRDKSTSLKKIIISETSSDPIHWDIFNEQEKIILWCKNLACSLKHLKQKVLQLSANGSSYIQDATNIQWVWVHVSKTISPSRQEQVL